MFCENRNGQHNTLSNDSGFTERDPMTRRLIHKGLTTLFSYPSGIKNKSLTPFPPWTCHIESAGWDQIAEDSYRTFTFLNLG